jgi:hypothetical protein
MSGFRTRLEIDPNPIVDGKRYVKRFEDVFNGTAQDTFDELQPEFLEALRYTPGASLNGLNSDQPFVWSTDPVKNKAARGWWFANFPNGRERTGALNDAWTVALERAGKALQLLVSNITPYTKWVVDTFDQRRNYQIPGHARTGWRRVNETTATFFDRFDREFRKRFGESIPRMWGDVTTTRRRNR